MVIHHKLKQAEKMARKRSCHTGGRAMTDGLVRLSCAFKGGEVRTQWPMSDSKSKRNLCVKLVFDLAPPLSTLHWTCDSSKFGNFLLKAPRDPAAPAHLRIV